MRQTSRCAKVNVKVLVIVIVVTVALGVSLVVARQVRRRILSKMDFEAGTAAFEKGDWVSAYKHLQEYLGRNPDDLEILRKYAQARLSVRPVEPGHILQAIAAYRRVLQLDPLDEAAYEKLAELYTGTGNFEDLAYIAGKRLEQDPNDLQAPLWLADALVHLNKTPQAQQTLEKLIGRLEALPDKHAQYVRACVGMSQIRAAAESRDAGVEALEWLNKAVAYAPDSARALAHRAHFYRTTPGVAGMSPEERLAAARVDLEAADRLGTDDPRVYFFLGSEWMIHGEPDRASDELKKAESLPQKKLEETFFDINDWVVARFLFAAELAMRRGLAKESAPLADEALKTLTEKRHRVQVLPAAIPLYIAAGEVSQARNCLDEYVEAMLTSGAAAESKLQIAYLQALVAGAERKPYAVINTLQPLTETLSGDPQARWRIWRLLANAYAQTGQPARAIGAQLECLRLYPGDPQMLADLARQYSRTGDWKKTSEIVQMAESAGATDLATRLLRIGAEVNLAVGQAASPDAAKLTDLAGQLDALRQAEPNQVDIRIFRALIADALGQSQEMEDHLKLAIAECDRPLKAQMQLARHYLAKNRTKEAIDLCKAASTRDPNSAEPWLLLAEVHMAEPNYVAARTTLERALGAVGPTERRAIFVRRALLELADGKRSAGIALLKDLAVQDPDDIQVHRILLSMPEVLRDQATAERLVGELRQTEGQGGIWWRFYEASLWLFSQDWDKQRDIVERLQYCINADPRWSEPVLLLAGMHERLGDTQRALDVYRQAFAQDPGAVDITDRLLTALQREGRVADAEQVLQKMQASPQVKSDLNIRMALGLRHLDRAIEELQVRAVGDSQDARVRIELARLVYEQSGDADRALTYLKEAEALDPNRRTLAAVRASILRAEGRELEAQKVLDAYVADHNDFPAYWMRAVFLSEVGELDRAESDYRKLTTFEQNRTAGYTLLANFYATTNRPDEAVATLEDGTRAEPNDLALQRNLMKSLFQRNGPNDRERALGILAVLEDKLPRDAELMKIRAVQLLEEQTLSSQQAAVQKLEEVVKLEPTAADAHLMLIGVAMQQGEYELAKSRAIKGLATNPKNSLLLVARARAELALDDTQGAGQSAHLALQVDPNRVDALAILADAALVSNTSRLTEEARTRIESTLRRNPANEPLLLLYARFLAALQEPKTAIPELTAYCRSEKGRTSRDALVMLADLHRLARDFEQAYAWIDQAAQVAPKSQTVLHARFLCMAAQSRWDDLAGISAAYIACEDQDPAIVTRAAGVLASLDTPALQNEGVKLFEHAVKTWPTLPDARLGLASALYRVGDIKRAKQTYQDLLERYPSNAQVLNDLAWIIQEQDGDYEAALKLADKGLSLAGSDTDRRHLLDTRGTILSKIDRLSDARADFEELLKLTAPDTAQRAKALLQLGRTCAKLGDVDPAKKHLQDALEIDRAKPVFTPAERTEIERLLQQGGK